MKPLGNEDLGSTHPLIGVGVERTREHEKCECESWSQRGPVIGLDGRGRRRVADLVERSGATAKGNFLKWFVTFY